MLRFRWSKFALLLFIFFSCSKPLPSFENIDLQTWRDDKNACSGKRTSIVNAIEMQREKLLGLSEQEIIALLGKPDENELYKRNQKFYRYYINPSKACLSSVNDYQKKLIVRFNAVGFAKEIGIE